MLKEVEIRKQKGDNLTMTCPRCGAVTNGNVLCPNPDCGGILDVLSAARTKRESMPDPSLMYNLDNQKSVWKAVFEDRNLPDMFVIAHDIPEAILTLNIHATRKRMGLPLRMRNISKWVPAQHIVGL